ncbi:MAG: porin [Parvibaculales bacterium]
MKKIILSTSLLAIMSAPAVAGGFDVSVGGYYNSVFYNIDSDAKPDAVENQFQDDAEIIFKGKAKEGDYTYGFEVQLEASQASDQIDEHFIYVKGPFGKVELGAENSAAYKIQVFAPKFLGWKTYDNNFKTWSKVSEFAKPDHANISKDANKINYYTPRFGGIQAAFSFTPSNEKSSGYGAGNGALLEKTAGKFEVMSFGVNYKGKVGDGTLKASYTMEDGDDLNGSKSAEDSAFGLNYKLGKFEIGGTAYEYETFTGSQTNETETLHLGAAYKVTKNTTLGLGFHDQEDKEAGAVADETEILIIGGNTKLTKGVKLTYSIEDVEATEVGVGTKDSTFMGVGLLLKF